MIDVNKKEGKKTLGNSVDPFAFVRGKFQEFYSNPENSDKYFDSLKAFLTRKAGLNISYYRDNYLHRRIYYRLMKLNIRSYKQYLQYLSYNPKEALKFKESFTIHVTKFFRDTKPFRYLEKNILPKIGREKGDTGKLRILCAPCSTGEEAYSLGIICEFLQKRHKLRCEYEILACDLERKVVDFASDGVYPRASLKNISKESVRRNFILEDDIHFRIKDEIRGKIKFFVHDLLKPIPLNHYDLVTCRNFLIYISKKHQSIVIRNIMDVMDPGGYLLLGKTEGFPLLTEKQFDVITSREHIYRYKG